MPSRNFFDPRYKADNIFLMSGMHHGEKEMLKQRINSPFGLFLPIVLQHVVPADTCHNAPF